MTKKRVSISISEETFNELETLREVFFNNKSIIKDRSEIYEEALIYGSEIIHKRNELRKKISDKWNIENININNIKI